MPINAVMLALCLFFSFSSQVLAQSSSQPADLKLQITDSKKWKDIFEKNAELAKVSPEQAKIEKNGWKQIPGMMDAWREWKEQRLAGNTEKAIETAKLADQEGEKAIETAKLADQEGEKAIETTLLKNQTELIKNIFLTAQNGSTEEQEKIRKSFLENDFGLCKIESLKAFCDDYKNGKVPPIPNHYLNNIVKYIKSI